MFVIIGFKTLKLEFQRSARKYNTLALFQNKNPCGRKKMSSFIDENSKISLNENEVRITKLLKEYTEFYNKNTKEKPICLRITGGWVRDKLMGRESHDIDIAIDHLSGVEFAEGLKSYILENGPEEAFADNSSTNLHKIEKNPEKSKHLETCTTKIFGNDIDFVNLRSEKYTEESRIPVISVGTPEEDALRRDATLNALFYNLTSMEVEDLTGKGMQDLEKGILRTPLDPETTFLDDPLRCLRLIRFASNYNFVIDPSAVESMTKENIRMAAQTKVSRERVGIEIRKMLLGLNPFYGLKLLLNTSFYDVIFDFGEFQEKILELNQNNDIDSIKYNLKTGLKESLIDIQDNLPKITKEIASCYPELNKILDDVMSLNFESTDKENVKVGFILSLVLNKWNDKKITYKNKKLMSATHIIILDAIKLPMKLADLVTGIVSKNDNFISKLEEYIKDQSKFSNADIVINFIAPYSENWSLNLLTCSIIESFRAGSKAEYNKIISKYDALYKRIFELGLQTSYNDKRIVDGKEVAKIFNKKPGPWMREINDQILIHQYNNRSITKDEMIAFVKELIKE